MNNEYVVETNENGTFLKKKTYKKNNAKQATEEEFKMFEKSLELGNDIYKFAKEQVKILNLEMQLVNYDISIEEKYIKINFLSKTRIDFRDLVRKITDKYRIKLELHQLGVRDRSSELGGLGQCGQELCCSRFLQKKDNINIGMAKKQNLALNPERINGVCGRLLCCLKYELDNYEKCDKKDGTCGCRK